MYFCLDFGNEGGTLLAAGHYPADGCYFNADQPVVRRFQAEPLITSVRLANQPVHELRKLHTHRRLPSSNNFTIDGGAPRWRDQRRERGYKRAELAQP